LDPENKKIQTSYLRYFRIHPPIGMLIVSWCLIKREVVRQSVVTHRYLHRACLF